jgi:hypothetical protein
VFDVYVFFLITMDGTWLSRIFRHVFFLWLEPQDEVLTDSACVIVIDPSHLMPAGEAGHRSDRLVVGRQCSIQCNKHSKSKFCRPIRHHLFRLLRTSN